jgi:hypothetical protein
MRSVFDLPKEHWVRVAHHQSIYHRRAIELSRTCGCFYCLKMFRPDQIHAWTDRHKSVPEQTALCPHCGIDSVVGDASGFAITETFPNAMNEHWFAASRWKQ